MIDNKSVKRIVLAGFFILAVLTARGQKQRLNHLTTFDDKLIHFGFTLGLSTLDFDVRNFRIMDENPGFSYQEWPQDNPQVTESSMIRTDVASLIPGFTVAIITNLRVSRDLDLRFLPGMSFGERKLLYNIPVVDNTVSYKDTQYDYSIKSTFLDFPVLMKYKANRINNGRPYVIFGGAMRYDISRAAPEDLVSLTRTGFYAELGGGWDTYLQFFRLSVEAKVSLGLNDQLGPGPGNTQRKYYTDAIRSLRSNVFTLSFHFE